MLEIHLVSSGKKSRVSVCEYHADTLLLLDDARWIYLLVTASARCSCEPVETMSCFYYSIYFELLKTTGLSIL